MRGDEVDKFLMGELLAGRVQECTIILSILLLSIAVLGE